MPDIDFYNMWRTETPGHRAALLAGMKEEAPVLASEAGFTSMTVRKCAEDSRVLVEGRWQSQESFGPAVSNDADTQEARASPAEFGSPKPDLFAEAFLQRLRC